MKKALIVTTQYVNNYGAVLQAYGMHSWMKRCGFEHEFLNQLSGDSCVFEKILPINSQTPYKLVTNLRRLKNYGDLKHRLDNFELFRKKYLPQTVLYKTQEEIVKSNFDYDIYITGGDQMFNRSCLNRPANLLEFGKQDAVRISYSTSIGSAVFSAEEEQKLVNSLNKYTALSAREENACKWLSERVNVPVRTNIDGVFLADKMDWENISLFDLKRYPQKYILVYELMYHPDLEKAVLDWKKHYKLPVVVITTNQKTISCADFVVRDAGPAEFVGLFLNASAILTTSFHGTCFSVIAHKPFLSLIRSNEKRINALLEKIKLSDCCKVHYEGFNPCSPDFTPAQEFFAKGREESEQYIGGFYGQ